MSGRKHCSAAFQPLHTTHPSKKCHPLWSLPTLWKSTSLRSLQLKHTTKPISDILFSLSVPPSPSLCVCLFFSEKKPTCVPTLSWPVAATKQAIWGVMAMWHLDCGHPAETNWVNATYPGRWIEGVEKESGLLGIVFSLRWCGGVREKWVVPQQ